jgi:hypothetical protein
MEERLRDERMKVERAFGKKFADVEARIQRAEARLSTQRWQFAARVGRLAWAVVDTAASAIGRGLPGRKRSLNPAITSAATERGQQSSAQLALDNAIQDRDRLELEYQEKLTALESSFDPVLFQLETIELKPQKSDVEVDEVSLVWLPFRIGAGGDAEPIY